MTSALCTEPGRVEISGPTNQSFHGNDWASSCPAFLGRFGWHHDPESMRLQCCSSTLQQRVLSRFKHHSCDQQSVPIARVLRALRGKSVALVGDSTMNQLWNALMLAVDTAGYRQVWTHRIPDFFIEPRYYNNDTYCSLSHDVKAKGGGSELAFELRPRVRKRLAASDGSLRSQRPCRVLSAKGGVQPPWPLRTDCLKLPEVEVHVSETNTRFAFYRMDGNFTRRTSRSYWKKEYAHCLTSEMHLGRLDAAARTSDVIITNLGVHYNFYTTVPEHGFEAYKSAMSHALTVLDGAAAQGKLGLFAESFVQHFANPAGDGLFAENEPKPNDSAEQRQPQLHAQRVRERLKTSGPLLKMARENARSIQARQANSKLSARPTRLNAKSLTLRTKRQHAGKQGGAGRRLAAKAAGRLAAKAAGRLAAKAAGRPVPIPAHRGPSCQCAALKGRFQEQQDARNELLWKLARPERVWPIAALLRPLHMLHRLTKQGCRQLDCTHYCFNPLLFEALLDGLFRRILNWGAASATAARSEREH